MKTADLKWQQRFLDVATEVSTWSKDPSTKVGCVMVSEDGVIVATGYNGIARGVQDHPERMERPTKYLWTVHAEAAAVANAARSGARLKGATAFISHMSCAGCARLMLNAGIECVVVGPGQTSLPAEEFEAAAIMFAEAGVKTMMLSEGALDDAG